MKTIDKDIDIRNLYLTSLPDWMGEIDIVNGYFNCRENLLTSLKNSPKRVNGGFYCPYNNISSLEGCPERVNGNFWCINNNLTSLEGCPEKVGGDFICYGNPGKFTEEYVRKVCDVKGKIFC
jgi:hypothetical protein